jgi:hypothetical protein
VVRVYTKFMVLSKNDCGIDMHQAAQLVSRDFENQAKAEWTRIGCVGVSYNGCIAVAMKFVVGDQCFVDNYNDWGGCPNDPWRYRQYSYRLERDPCARCQCCRLAPSTLDDSLYGEPTYSWFTNSLVKMTKVSYKNSTDVCKTCDQDGCDCVVANIDSARR